MELAGFSALSSPHSTQNKYVFRAALPERMLFKGAPVRTHLLGLLAGFDHH